MKRAIIVLILIISLISASYSDTSGYVSFTFRIDKSAPTYSELSANTTEVSNINELVLFSAYWEDNYVGLKDYYFTWNMTGTFDNTTSRNYAGNWSNITRAVSDPDAEGTNISYGFYAFDKNNNMNYTGNNYFSVINKAPEYSEVTQSNSTPADGEVITLSAYWTDNFNIYDSVLETNKTGAWSTTELMTPDSNPAWTNYTFNTSGFIGQSIAWRIKAADNANNINTTEELIFSVI